MGHTAEIVLFSDFHAHNHTYGAKWVQFEGKAINSRLYDAIMVLRQIRTYCATNSIKIVLFGGDLFHTREAVKTTVHNTIVDELRAFDDVGVTLVMIPGNHDMADREGLQHSMKFLHNFSHIYVVDADRPGPPVVSIEGVNIWCVPYTEDKDKALERIHAVADEAQRASFPNILLAHQGLIGADLGADFVQQDEHDLTVADLKLDAFTCCFFGHFHKHQKVADNAWYIGATQQHNWGDAGDTRGFLHFKIDTETRAYSFKRVEAASPRFVHYYAEEAINIKPRKGDFVRVHSSDTATDAMKKSFEAAFGSHIEMVPVLEQADTSFVLQEEQLHADGLIDAWVDQRASDGYDKDRLKNLGKRLLAKAESKEL